MSFLASKQGIGGHLAGFGHLGGEARLPRSVPRPPLNSVTPRTTRPRSSKTWCRSMIRRSAGQRCLRASGYPRPSPWPRPKGKSFVPFGSAGRGWGGRAVSRLPPYVNYAERCKRRELERQASALLRAANIAERKAARPDRSRSPSLRSAAISLCVCAILRGRCGRGDWCHDSKIFQANLRREKLKRSTRNAQTINAQRSTDKQETNNYR